MKELDVYYGLEYRVMYKGIALEPMSMIAGLLKKMVIYVVTDSAQIAERLNFRRCDKFYYGAEIPLKDVEKLIVERKYFEGTKKGETDIISFLKGYPDNL